MSNLIRYKLQLLAVFIVIIGGILLWTELDGLDLKSCSELLREDGIVLSDDVDTSASCDDLEYQSTLNASEELMICNDPSEKPNSQALESNRDRAVVIEDCSTITQNSEFQSE